MPVVGAIANHTRSIIPITWDALEKDSRYGDALLQRSIDTIKEKVLGEVVAVSEEDNYPLLVIDYVAKSVALQLIPAGIDFWMNQSLTESTTGPDEVVTFTDRANQLRLLQEQLLRDTRGDWPVISTLITFRRTVVSKTPRLSTIEDDLLTPSPQEFPRPFARTARS